MDSDEEQQRIKLPARVKLAFSPSQDSDVELSTKLPQQSATTMLDDEEEDLSENEGEDDDISEEGGEEEGGEEDDDSLKPNEIISGSSPEAIQQKKLVQPVKIQPKSNRRVNNLQEEKILPSPLKPASISRPVVSFTQSGNATPNQVAPASPESEINDSTIVDLLHPMKKTSVAMATPELQNQSPHISMSRDEFPISNDKPVETTHASPQRQQQQQPALVLSGKKPDSKKLRQSQRKSTRVVEPEQQPQEEETEQLAQREEEQNDIMQNKSQELAQSVMQTAQRLEEQETKMLTLKITNQRLAKERRKLLRKKKEEEQAYKELLEKQKRIKDEAKAEEQDSLIQQEKEYLLVEFWRYEKAGIPLRKKFDESSDIKSMRFEFYRLKMECKIEEKVAKQWEFFRGINSGLEYMNKKWNPFGIEMVGWSQTVEGQKTEYLRIFRRMCKTLEFAFLDKPVVQLFATATGQFASFIFPRLMDKITGTEINEAERNRQESHVEKLANAMTTLQSDLAMERKKNQVLTEKLLTILSNQHKTLQNLERQVKQQPAPLVSTPIVNNRPQSDPRLVHLQTPSGQGLNPNAVDQQPSLAIDPKQHPTLKKMKDPLIIPPTLAANIPEGGVIIEDNPDYYVVEVTDSEGDEEPSKIEELKQGVRASPIRPDLQQVVTDPQQKAPSLLPERSVTLSTFDGVGGLESLSEMMQAMSNQTKRYIPPEVGPSLSRVKPPTSVVKATVPPPESTIYLN